MMAPPRRAAQAEEDKSMSNHPEHAPGNTNGGMDVDKPATTSRKPGSEDGEEQTGSREFSASTRPDAEAEQAIIVDQGAADPETLVAGGEPGTVPGDRQAFGEVPTIMDQDEAT